MTTLSDAYRNAPLLPHHIIPLDFDSVKHVPESHSWENSDSGLLIRIQPQPPESLPIIDLADPSALNLVGQACQTWGMFQVTNHGISSALLRDVEYETGRFFSLPAKEKTKALRSPGGASGYGVARITPFFNKFMWHEGFTIVESPVDHAREVWPHAYQRFCEVMEEYQKKMKELAERLLVLILKYLGLPGEPHDLHWLPHPTSDDPFRPASCTALQLNYYPSCPNPAQAMGLAPHTDSFLLTILHQVNGTHGGLEVLKDGAGWVRVVPTEGALLVNVGDMLRIMSNDLFPSVLHRVVVDKTRHRMSLAYFYGPPMDHRLSPILAGGAPVRFRPVTVREYIEMKAKNLDDALSRVRVRS
ncbi:hypothetical protein SAY86_009365 [Trapa natans]|uniref:gibberellin 3beta-dioxygenase n=1 Tax=Trapa natans TaxID=22666 RepID=A0AAN7L3T1_TRANT|nr:hypothetical protein SAY86_009365 [Trapa natans]